MGFWIHRLEPCFSLSIPWNVSIYWTSSFTNRRAKAKICSTFAFEFFLKFWIFVGSIQFSFLFSFQKYKFFWNRTKIDVFTMFFPWNYFLYARIPSFLENGKQHVKVLGKDFRCHVILWVTMWAEFFSHCDSHCEKIVRKLWVEMNTLIR